MTLQEIHEWVFSDLGFCGCGDPEAALGFLRDTLNILNKEFEQRWDEIQSRFPDDSPIAWSYLYMLDDKGLIEHGGNIKGSWLTDRGKEIRAALNAFSLESIIEDEADVLDEAVITL